MIWVSILETATVVMILAALAIGIKRDFEREERTEDSENTYEQKIRRSEKADHARSQRKGAGQDPD